MFEWITTNWTGILAAVAGAHALALAVVNLTPTPKDDAILAKVYKVVEFVAGFFTSKAKETGTETEAGSAT